MGINFLKDWVKINIAFIKSKIKNINERKNYKFKHIHHTNLRNIDKMYDFYSPIFVLSTGRTGTKYLAKIMNYSKYAMAYHEPRPTLQYFSNYAFRNQKKIEVLEKIIDSARNELILDSFNKNKQYIETNHCITFFAPVIKDLYKSSKFIHLIRHPAEFVRSALRKGWYINDTIWEIGRVKMEKEDRWNSMDIISKLIYLWNCTNLFIENFKENIRNKSRVITIKSNDIFSNTNTLVEIFNFAGIKIIGKNKLKKMQNIPINSIDRIKNFPENIKISRNYPIYKEWNENQKEIFKKQVSKKLIDKYGFKL